MYYSQSNQDKWVNEVLNNKKNGFFVDVGAYDGVETSNTLFFEETLNWSGVCIEANYSFFQSLIKNRKSKNVNLAVTDYKGECFFSGHSIKKSGPSVKCDTLNNIFLDYSVPEIIDYLSIDIEGFEYIALKDFDFSKYHINLITVEHNLYVDGPERKNKIYEILTKNGFIREVEDVLCLDPAPAWNNKPYEDWYINNKLL